MKPAQASPQTPRIVLASTSRYRRELLARLGLPFAIAVPEVDDEGVGIPDSDRALVTEPFHRAWNVRESRIPGTGLGLYICRELCERHGARIAYRRGRRDARTPARAVGQDSIIVDSRVTDSEETDSREMDLDETDSEAMESIMTEPDSG